MAGMLNSLVRKLAPAAEDVVKQMNEVACVPEPYAQNALRSDLLVVGQYEPGGDLTLNEHLAYYRFNDAAWIDESTKQPVEMPITHWLYASEQDKLR